MSGAPPLPSFTKKWYKNTYPAIDPSRPELSAAGKIIVVTGAGSGIGAAIAIAFAKAGADGIALIGRREHTLAQTNSTIKKNYPQVNVLVATGNVSSKASIDDAFNKISSTFGKIDVFVPNAGSINPPGPVATLDGEAWFECFKINTLGSLYSTQAFIPHAATNAYILNISSGIIHFPPFPGMSGYATSKLAGTKLFDYVQAENPELHVVNIQPGIIDTDVNRISGMPPLDTVDLAASFTVWLTSPEAKFLKGKFVYANWDVEELKERATEIENSDMLLQALAGVQRADMSKLA